MSTDGYRWKLSGERWEFQRTDVTLKEFPFPVPPVRLSYVPEGIVWSRIARKYKTRYVNEPGHCVAISTPKASLSRSRDFKHVMRIRRMFYRRVVLNEHLDFFRHAPLDFIRAAANYVRWSLHLRRIGTSQDRDVA